MAKLTVALIRSIGFHSATLLTSGIVLVAGGAAPSGVQNTAEIYDPVAQTFSSAGTLATPRARHAAVRLQIGVVLLAGGVNTAVLSSAEVY